VSTQNVLDSEEPTTRTSQQDKSKADWFLPFAVVAVVLFGALLRTVRLHTDPPGLFFDEAANLFDISAILGGWHPLYFPANNGREPLFFYWASLFASVWGANAYALRLAAAMIGTITLATTFLCARETYRLWDRRGRWADWTALGATFILAILYAHVHFSRFGLRTIALPLFLSLSYGLLFLGLRRNSWWAYTAAGIAGGVSVYTYIASRIAPILLGVPLVAAPGRFRRLIAPLVWVGVVWVIVCVPLGLYALRHPNQVEGHTNDVSMLNPANNHGDPVGGLIHGTVATFEAINFVGSEGAEQNLPGRPLLDPIQSLFFFVGLGALARGGASRKDEGATKEPVALSNGLIPGSRESRRVVTLFLVVWIVSQLIPPILSVNPPSYIRLTGMFPALAILVGLGIGYAVRSTRGRVGNLAVGGVLGVALVASTAWTVRDYFFVWAPSPTAYMWMMGHKVDSSNRLNAIARTDRVFLAPLYAQDYTIRYLTRGSPIQSFDLGLSLVVPTDRSSAVHYVFPANEQDAVQSVLAALPVKPRIVQIYDPTGRFHILTELDLAPSQLPKPPSERLATFDGRIALVGRTGPNEIAAGQDLPIVLEWEALKPSPENDTIFLHLRDAANQTVAQVDRQPTNGTDPTSQWHVGDLVWDRIALAIPNNLPAGHYRLVGGLYRLADQKRLAAELPTGPAPADEVTLAEITVR